MDSQHSRSISQGASFTGAFSPTSSRGQGLALSSVLRCHGSTNNNNNSTNERAQTAKNSFSKTTVRRVNNPALEGSSAGPEQVTASLRNLVIGSDKKRMRVQQQDRWMGTSDRVCDPVFTLLSVSPPQVAVPRKKFDSSSACFSSACHSRASSVASLPEIVESSQASSSSSSSSSSAQPATETEPWRSLGRSTRSPTRRYKRRSPLSESGRPENPHARVLLSFRSAAE